MTDTRYALAHGEPIVVVAPEGVDAAISEVMARHRAELDEALAPFGVALDDLMQATWMRVVRFADVVPLGDPPVTEEEVARTVLPLLDGLDDDRPAGGCCGSGEACSSAACTGTPRAAAPAVDGVYMTDLLRDPGPFGERIDVHPEPRQDAAVLGAPGVPMSGPVFGRGGVRGDDE